MWKQEPPKFEPATRILWICTKFTEYQVLITSVYWQRLLSHVEFSLTRALQYICPLWTTSTTEYRVSNNLYISGKLCFISATLRSPIGRKQWWYSFSQIVSLHSHYCCAIFVSPDLTKMANNMEPTICAQAIWSTGCRTKNGKLPIFLPSYYCLPDTYDALPINCLMSRSTM